MRLDDLDYDLPPDRIAQSAVEPRDASRLLVARRGDLSAPAEHRVFRDLVDYLRAGDLLVVNDTRVLPARLHGEREDTGGTVECLVVSERAPGVWEAMVRPGRRMRPGVRLVFGGGRLRAEVREVLPGGLRLLAFEPPDQVHAALAELGVMPLPPYIRRSDVAAEVHAADRERYQTVYATVPGAVAAPTAGLHFTDALLGNLRTRGVQRAQVTLHVGPGTFRPISAEDPRAHDIHAERYACPPETVRAIERTRAAGGRVIACGTTTVRVLESVAAGAPLTGRTRLFIHPPFAFRHVDALITNFHLPRSSLLLLVAAFLGSLDRLKALYAEALREGYRFYSYGDAMLVL